MGGRLLVLLSLLASAELAAAADQVVSDPGDSGSPNQLRAKLAAAQATGGGTITFTTGPATIVLTSTLPAITSNITIDGGNVVSISGANSFRIFVVSSGTTTLRNLTLTKGFSSGGDGGAIVNNATLNIVNCKFMENQTGTSWSGGAIVSYGPLTITNSEFAFNKGGGGGAVYPRFSNAVTTITGSSFHDNEAINPSGGALGGAILLWDGAQARVRESTFTNNSARTAGGAVFGQGPSAFIPDQCAFIANRVTDTFAEGGAIYLQGSGEIRRCTFTYNHGSRGGALFVASGTTLVRFSTFDTNWAAYGGGARVVGGTLDLSQVVMGRNGYSNSGTEVTTGGGALSQAGGLIAANNVTILNSWASYGAALYRDSSGIDIESGFLTTTNVTITNNQASFFGAGVSVRGGTYTPRNTIVAKNIGRPNFERSGSGVVNSAGFNLCDDTSGSAFLTNSSDKNGPQYDPLLAPLAMNGGYAFTYMPQPGSPAIDNGTATGAPARDQRGFSRAGAAYDIGAVEANGVATPVTLGNVVSRKTHGGAGVFDINLPLVPPVGVECRSGGVNGDHTVLFTFVFPIGDVGSASVTSGTGSVGRSLVATDARQYAVDLTGVANGQEITLRLHNIVAEDQSFTQTIDVSLGILAGDTNGSRIVNATDIGQTKAASGQPVTGANFRQDVNVSGSINASDIGLVKSQSGSSLP